MGSQRVLLISSDCHAGLRTKDYKPYLESKFHGALDQYEKIMNTLYRELDPFPRKLLQQRAEVAYDRSRFQDSQGRLEDLEMNGVVSEVLFPGATYDTAAPWSDYLSVSSFRARTLEQRNYQMAGERAYNRWLAEFCANVPTGRRIGLAFVPFHDLDAAVDQCRWAADQGMCGILMPFFNYDLPEYCQGWYWDPIWAVCSETRLSLNFHGGSGMPEVGQNPQLHFQDVFFVRRAISHLIMTGVFDRFPDLRFTVTEGDASWVPEMLTELDAIYDRARANQDKRSVFSTELSEMKPDRRPSEYWPANGYVGVSINKYKDMKERHKIGVGQMMYGIDYPHPEGSWGQTTGWLQATLGRVGATESEARMILGENAARLYDIDIRDLLPVAERVGPTINEVLTSMSDEDIDVLLDEMEETGRPNAAIHYTRQELNRSDQVREAVPKR